MSEAMTTYIDHQMTELEFVLAWACLPLLVGKIRDWRVV